VSGRGPIHLDYAPRAWQRQCHEQRKRFTVLVLHRRAGKTELAIMELLDKALQCQRELGLFAYVAPFLKQAKIIAWSRLKQRLAPLKNVGAVEIREGDLQIQFKHNGATIQIFGADNADALRGVRLDGVVIDEVAQIEPSVWDEIIQAALADRKGWAIFIGTPNGINLFSQLYFGAAGRSDWHAARYTVNDTGALDAEEVERLKRDLSESAFAREFLCDFAASGEDQLISLVDAQASTRRVHFPDDIQHAPRVLGVDPARFGDDRSVLVLRQGLVTFGPRVYRGLDNMALAAKIAQHIVELDPDAVFIDAGAGAGVIDRLRQIGHDVIEVPFGGKANEPHRYVNRRTEMWWQMKSWLVGGGSIPAPLYDASRPAPTHETDVRSEFSEALQQELATPKYWYDAQGRVMLESKDDIKRRLQGGASPDLADALALTFAAPVRPRNVDIYQRARDQKRRGEWDPYGRMHQDVGQP
jgi:hypothetical protein